MSTRPAWCRATRTRCGPCGRSTSTPASATSISSTSAQRPFRRALEAIGVTDIFFELFDATHDAIEYRYPIAIKYLAERLTP